MAPRSIFCVLLLSLSSSVLLFAPPSKSQSPNQVEFCEAGVGSGETGCDVSSKSSSSSKLLIKGGTVVNAHAQEVADVYVEDGIIVAVGDDVYVIDATGKFVMPGGIDPHTHLAMEFMGTETIDDFFSGQAAALAGGTTMHIDFVIPVNGSLTAGLEAYEKKAKKSCMDYGFHMAITKWDEIVSREMEIMVKEKGINSFKFFLAYKGSLMINDDLLIEGLKRCKSLGALAMVHAENGDAVFEGQKRMIELGITGPEGHALSRPPVVCHESPNQGIRTSQGPASCPFSWTSAAFAILQLVGTDHCAFNSTQKSFGIDDFRKIPNGVNGIEERMHLVWDVMVESGQISVTDYVRVTSTECARIFNIYPKKGAVLAGSDADIIILNPNATVEISMRSHHSRTDTNVYEGRQGKGKVDVTISRGRVVWENDELKVFPGSGKYIETPPFNYLFSGVDKADAAYLASLKAPYCEADIGSGETGCGVSPPSSSKLLIKGGTVVNAHRQQSADVYVEDGVIVAVEPNLKVGDDVYVLDATGKYVMPGGIDPHTHLAFEFMGTEAVDDFLSGQAAALAGGTTMHIDFVIPVNGSLTAGFERYMEKAKDSCMDYGFHMAITKWDDTVSREMEIMVKEKGINSFKFFLAYKGDLMINDELLLEGLKKCKSLGALAMVHGENGDAVFEGQKRMIELGITGPEGHSLSRPPLLEREATARAIRLAGFVNTPLYVVHVMSIDAMEEIAEARKSGQRVIGEPVVSGLVLDDSLIWDPDFFTASKYVMSPPIRASGHNKALQAALSNGILQLVGTDHCGFNSTQKALGIDDFRKIPNGVIGIEERMHLVWDTMVVSGQISVTDFVRVTSTEGARIFNIYPEKGAILAGSDADIIILNPNASFEISARSHHSRTDINVFEGRRGKGKVEVTIARGRVVWENDELKVVPGSGKYIKMSPFSYLFGGIDKADVSYLSSLNAPVKRNKSPA
ncbi:hypothetical protein Tsubulata_036737 [Turnera subulata]|uniref:dihydropyrimidinase n=1 Tax=Turnera subulata TaxID=218843 RepID=A0A9Q0IZC6_9ROSI|nr:hypothetical protein Tsubulata_036737 [Turnera subulata]